MSIRDIGLTVLIFGLLPYCLTRPWIGILTWNWIGLMNPHRLTWGFAYHFPFAQLVALSTLAGLVFFSKDRKPVPWCLPLALVLVMFLYFAGTSFFAWMPDQAWYRWKEFSKVILMTFVSTMLISGRDRVKLLFVVVALSVGFYGIKGGIWTILHGGAHQVHGPAQSFLSENTFIGLGLCMVLPLIAALAKEEKNLWLRRALNASVFLCVMSTVFTYSRGALLGLSAVLPLIFLNAKRRVVFATVAIPVALGIALWAPPELFKRAETIGEYEQDISAKMRIQSWTVAYNIAKESPVTGAGIDFEHYPDARRWFSYADPTAVTFMHGTSVAHSIYFQILGQHGFVGLGLFLAVLFTSLSMLGKVAKQSRSHPEVEWIANYASAIRVGIVGYMVAGAFLSSAYFDLIYVFVSLAAILRRELLTWQAAAKSSPSDAGSPAPQRPGGMPAPVRPANGREQPYPASGRAFRDIVDGPAQEWTQLPRRDPRALPRRSP